MGCLGPQTQRQEYTIEELYEEIDVHRELTVDGLVEKKKFIENYLMKRRKRALDVWAKVSKGATKACALYDDDRSGDLCLYDVEVYFSFQYNAYTDGKTIYFTHRMVDFLKTDEELATVMAHEVAHGIMGHIPAGILNFFITRIASSLFDTIAINHGINNFDDYARQLAEEGLLAYSREFEHEADYVGLYIMKEAGYDITTAPNVWRRFSQKNGYEDFAITTTHPSNPERFILLNKTVDEIHEKARKGEELMPNPVEFGLSHDHNHKQGEANTLSRRDRAF